MHTYNVAMYNIVSDFYIEFFILCNCSYTFHALIDYG